MDDTNAKHSSDACEYETHACDAGTGDEGTQKRVGGRETARERHEQLYAGV
jgi:hypothetical protein